MAAVRYRVGSDDYSADQLVELGASNADLFFQLFFPKTVRAPSAPAHLELDAALQDPTKRYVHARMSRDWAKTTRLRLWGARRIAYGLSNAGIYIGPSEAHASRSLRWLRRQIQFNTMFSSVFGLELVKWGDTELGIINKSHKTTCWFLAMGITTNARGVNFDDYRPDFIALDDIVTDENAASKDQREKVSDLVEGSIKGSLASPIDNPNAKMVLIQTPLNSEDVSAEVVKDPEWTTIISPCWTKATLDLATDEQESSWPERWPSEDLRLKKKSAIARNKLSVFTREYEVRIISKETAAFRPDWLKQVDVLPNSLTCRNILFIDPVPPPSPAELEKGLKGKDFEAIGVVGQRGEDYFVLEYEAMHGHQPNWTVSKFFELAQKHHITKAVVEGVAYQRTLKWILEEEMRRRQIWYMVEAVTDKRSKYNRIVSTLSGIASQGHFFCHTSHTELIHQFQTYLTPGEVVDVLDGVAIGMSRLINPALEVGDDVYIERFGNVTKLKAVRPGGCP